MSPDFALTIERLVASLHTSSPPAQVNHRQYHCFHHQAEAYAIYDTFGVTWWTNFQLMEVKPTVSQISNNCKWCHLVAKCWWKWSERWMFETLTFFQVLNWWNAKILFQEILLIRFVRNILAMPATLSAIMFNNMSVKNNFFLFFWQRP